MEDNPEISIVIPAYNEEARLSVTLGRIIEYLESRRFSFEIIVVNDGSHDNTAGVVREYMHNCQRLSLIENTGKTGKGFSVKKGILNSKGRFIFFSDADLSTPIEEIDKLLGYLKDGYSIAFASRALLNSQVVIREAWYRDTMGKIFGFLVRHTLLPGIRDTQCGFKGFRKNIIPGLFKFQQLRGFAFDVEVLLIARNLGLSIKEIPIRWIDSPKSKVNPIIDSCKMLFELFSVCLNNLLGKYRL